MTPIATSSRPRRRRGALLSVAAIAGLLAAPGAARAVEIPLDLSAYGSRSFTFTGRLLDATGPPPRGENAGQAIAGDCDVTGDGRPDLIVGAPNATGGTEGDPRANAGRIYVVPGGTGRAPASHELATVPGVIVIEGHATSQNVGAALACAGDVDGDGADDLIVGISTATPAPQRGATVVFGGADLVAARTITTDALGIHGYRITSTTARVGTFVAGVGDVDGDRKDDVAVVNGSLSIADVVAGQATTAPVDLTVPGSSLLRVTGVAADEVSSIARVGDHGSTAGSALDGVDDFAIGAQNRDVTAGTRAGVVVVVDGAATGEVRLADAATDAKVLLTIEGPATDAKAGALVVSAGDVDGDGNEDLAVGQLRGRTLAGPAALVHRSVWVVYGSGRRVGDRISLASLGGDGYELVGQPSDTVADDFGESLAPLGDVDGDGNDDLAVGAYSFRSVADPQLGAVYLVYGRDRGAGGVTVAQLTCEQGARLYGTRSPTGLGASVAAGGTFGGDDTPHLLVGAALNDTVGYGNFVQSIPLTSSPGGCDARREPPVELEVDFGLRENFRRYIWGGYDAARPAVPITTSGGAACDVTDDARGGCDPGLRAFSSDPWPRRVLRWTPIGAGATDGSDTTVATIGTVTFRYPGHGFTLNLQDPWFVVADGQLTVRARLDLDVVAGSTVGRAADARVVVGTYPLDGPVRRTRQYVQWRTDQGVMSDVAVATVGSFPSAAELDPVTITIPRSLGELPPEPTVPQERGPEPRQPDPGQPDPRGPVVVPPSKPIATIAGARGATVRRAGSVTAATLRCGTAACTVSAPRALTVTLGRGRRAKRVAIAVRAPKRLASGRRGTVALLFERADLRALAGRTVRLKLPLAVRAGGRRVAKTITVTITVPRSLGAASGAAPRAKRKGAR